MTKGSNKIWMTAKRENAQFAKGYISFWSIQDKSAVNRFFKSKYKNEYDITNVIFPIQSSKQLWAYIRKSIMFYEYPTLEDYYISIYFSMHQLQQIKWDDKNALQIRRDKTELIQYLKLRNVTNVKF